MGRLGTEFANFLGLRTAVRIIIAMPLVTWVGFHISAVWFNFMDWNSL